MARRFLLRCSGTIMEEPILKNKVHSALAHAMNGADMDALCRSTSHAPTWVIVEGTTLENAVKIDRLLMKMGIISQLYWFDTSAPDVRKIFIEQRQGLRRAPTSAPLAKPATVDPKTSERRKVAKRGRRKTDGL